jgi:uncharacterized protein (TIGR02246 family)
MTQTVGQIALEIAATLEKAWNSGDAAGFANVFAEDADFIHILGGHGRGRDAIAQAHKTLFTTIYRGSRVTFELAGTRPVGPDAFLACLVQHLVFGPGPDVQRMTCRPTLAVARQDQGWSIVLMQNTRTVETAPTGLSDHPFAPQTAETVE